MFAQSICERCINCRAISDMISRCLIHVVASGFDLEWTSGLFRLGFPQKKLSTSIFAVAQSCSVAARAWPALNCPATLRSPNLKADSSAISSSGTLTSNHALKVFARALHANSAVFALLLSAAAEPDKADEAHFDWLVGYAEISAAKLLDGVSKDARFLIVGCGR